MLYYNSMVGCTKTVQQWQKPHYLHVAERRQSAAGSDVRSKLHQYEDWCVEMKTFRNTELAGIRAVLLQLHTENAGIRAILYSCMSFLDLRH